MIVLATANCRHSHTSPALRILRNLALDHGYGKVQCFEFALTDPVWKMANAILAHAPRLVGLSISIWNRTLLLALAHRLRAAAPHLVLVAGGPELSFADEVPPPFDHLVRGDGELPWLRILAHHIGGANENPLPALLGRYGDAEPGTPRIWPYRDQDFPHLRGRMAYVETTRGCPFRCAFCQSACDRHVRTWFDPLSDEFLAHIRELHQAGVTTFKFLDRTFNANPQRAMQAIRALAECAPTASFHLEIAPDILTDELIDTLNSMPAGMFQLEIGIQSIHPHVLEAISRPSDFAKVRTVVKRLVAGGRVHIHADLIWGLPGETLAEIEAGFDALCELGVDELQLGFLKFLPGAPIQAMREKHNYLVSQEPPYEFFANDTLSGTDVLFLQRFAHCWDVFANSKRFTRTLRHLRDWTGLSPFRFHAALAERFHASGLVLANPGLDRLYEWLLQEFPAAPLLKDCLRLDYVLSQRVHHVPTFLAADTSISHGLRQRHQADGRSLVVAFAHRIDLERREVTDEPELALYLVKYGDRSGYFPQRELTRLES